MSDGGVAVYFEEITSDDEGPETHHDGEEVEQVQPFELPVHTLTADMVADYKAAEARKPPAAAAPAPAALPTPPPAPRNPESEAIRERGNAAFGAKRFEEAVGLYSEALALDSSNGLLYGNRAAALLQLKRVSEAVADACEMVRLLPTMAKAHFRLGSALSASGQPADAAKALVAALKLEPTNEAIAEALRTEMSRPALKKGQQHAPLLSECQQALAAAKASKAAGAAAGASASDPVPVQPRPRWAELPTPGGVRPPKRGGATLNLVGGRLWLVGGADRTGLVHQDVWEYVLEEHGGGGGGGSGGGAGGSGEGGAPVGWRLHELAGGLSPRSGHAAATVPAAALRAPGAAPSTDPTHEDADETTQANEDADEALLIFGGQDPRSSVLLNDVSLLHVPARSGLTARWTTPLATRGATPAARNGHSFTGDPEGNAVLLFGGADDESHRNDVWRLTLGATAEDGGAKGGGAPCAEWTAMTCTGIPPQPREMHIAAVLPTRRRLLVHGGRSGEDIVNDARVLCLKSWVWSNPLNSACRRVGHAVTLLPAALAADAPTAKLILFGGFTGEGLSNDVWTVAPDAVARGEAGAFEQLPTRGAPATRFAHCVAAASDRLLVFGGSAPASECDDLFEVRLPLA